MITGEVKPTREPIIQVTIRGPRQEGIDLLAVVDTGFTEYLTLPLLIVEQLGLPYFDTAAYGLADGGEAMFDVYEGSLNWDGRWRNVFIAAADGGPLVGMALLQGYHLGIDVVDGGRVEIRPLSELGA